MARHSHWHSIKIKKGAEDKKRGKVFTKHARLIAVAASKSGGDPSMNPLLRMAIESARLENVPKENIERAIKKGTGEDKSASGFSEILYEGYGPFGAALLILTVSDNKNRTLANIKHILGEHGGSLGGQSSTSFLFEKKGLIEIKGTENKEEDELRIIDSGAEDFEDTGEASYLVYADPMKLGEVKNKLAQSGFKIKSAELIFESKTPVEIKAEKKQKIISLLEALEEDEDVMNVFTNVLL